MTEGNTENIGGEISKTANPELIGERPSESLPGGGRKNLFSSTNQPEKRGVRPPSMLKVLEQATGIEFKVNLPKAEKFTILECMMEKSEDELDKIIADKESPIFMRTLAKSFKQSLASGSLGSLETILDRIFGRPKQDLSATMTGNMEYTINFAGNRFRDRRGGNKGNMPEQQAEEEPKAE